MPEEKPPLKRGRDLTQGSILKNIWVLAVPMMLGNLLQTTFNVVDTIFVGRLGPEAVAAVTMSGTILFTIMSLLFGLAMATTAMIARAIGAKDQERANNVAMQTLLLGGIFSALLVLLGVSLARPFLNLLGPEPDVLELGASYLRVQFFGIGSMFYLFMINAILRGAGDALTPMKILGFSTLLNIGLDPLLIFGPWIFPELGVVGAALATVIARSVGVVIGLYVLFKGNSAIQVSWAKTKISFATMWTMIKIGFPSSIDANLRSISGLFLMGIVSGFGTLAVAAFGISMRIDFVIMIPGFGLASATATLVGQNLGAKEPKRAEKTAWASTGLYILISAVVGLLLFLFAEGAISIFNPTPGVVVIGAEILRIKAVGYIFFALSTILARTLGGAGDTLSPMIMTALSVFAVMIPLALVLPRVGELGMTGVWLAIVISMVGQALITALWFNVGKWKEKEV